MNILTIPLRSTRRKPLRFLLLLLVFTLGVSSIVGLGYVSREVGDSMEKKLIAFGANILITPKTETLTVSYGGFDMGNLLFEMQYLDEQNTIQRIRSIAMNERLAAVAPKLVAMDTVNETPVGLVGVRWDQELNIKSFWVIDGGYPQTPDDVVLGSSVASALGLAPGDPIALKGGELNVVGVLQPTGGEDDKVIFTDLGRLQSLTGNADKMNYVEVAALCAGCPIEDIVAQIRGKLDGVDIQALQSVVKQRMFSVDFVQRLAMAVGLVILVTACAMVGLSMLSAVNERKREIGLLRCLGYGKSRVFAIFCIEAMVIGVISGALGYLAGFGVSHKVLEVLDVVEDASIGFEPSMLFATVAAIAVVSVLSAVIPAWKASRVEPSQALIAI